MGRDGDRLGPDAGRAHRGVRREKAGEGEIPPTELAASIQKKLALPYKLVPDKVPPDALMRFFRRTRKEARGQFTPVLVPAEEALDQMLDRLTAGNALPSPDTALAVVPVDGKAILDRRWRALFETEEAAQNPPPELLGELAGSKEQLHFLSCQKDGAPMETLMLRLPIIEGWQAPAYIPVGGECGMPDTGELLAVCKYWFDKYRAVPAAMGHSSMEFVLPKVIPQEQAMEVAKEHYAFCPDRVRRDTKTGTIGEVADELWQSTLWYFRWYGEEGEAPLSNQEDK